MNRARQSVLDRHDPGICSASGNVFEYLPKAGGLKGNEISAIEGPSGHAAKRSRYSLIGYPLSHGWWMIPQNFYGNHYRNSCPLRF